QVGAQVGAAQVGGVAAGDRQTDLDHGAGSVVGRGTGQGQGGGARADRVQAGEDVGRVLQRDVVRETRVVQRTAGDVAGVEVRKRSRVEGGESAAGVQLYELAGAVERVALHGDVRAQPRIVERTAGDVVGVDVGDVTAVGAQAGDRHGTGRGIHVD